VRLIELVKAALSEQSAEEFLKSVGVLKKFEQCYYCSSCSVTKVGRNFYKC
jgi:hypothetical protein